LHAAVRHLTRTYRTGDEVEMWLLSVFQALDTLLEQFDLERQGPEGLCSEDTRAATKRVLRRTRKELIQRIEEVPADERYRRGVADIVSGAGAIRVGFGRAVVRLLDRFDLPDAEIMQDHLANSPRADGREWVDVLPRLRGMAVHEGYIDFSDPDWPVTDALDIVRHLHDITARIILTLLGYDGEYQPTVTVSSGGKALDWATPDTSAQELGYGRGM
jgi:hypothetical protein